MSNLTSNAPSGQGSPASSDGVHIFWISKRPDEVRFCQLLANTGRPEKVFATGLRPFNLADQYAARFVEVGQELFARNEAVTPEAIGAGCQHHADESTSASEAEEWEHAAQIAYNELELPRDFPSQGNVSDEAAKLAAKIVTKRRGSRTKGADPTPDEIRQTAAAISEQIGTFSFPDRPAHEIPSPALLTGDKPAYDDFQLRELLYPDGKTVSLCSEAGHAERAALYIGEDIVFSPELGALHYDKRHRFWRQDDKDRTLTAAKLAALATVVRVEAATLLRYAATLAATGREGDARAMSRAANELLSHSKHIEKQSFLTGAAKFLAAERRAKAEQFAPVAWRFAFKNCVFFEGQWRPARRDDFLLHVSPVEMSNRADRREWCALLNRITAGDEDFARTLQEVCAYALSGAATLRALPWLYGPGGTGKSTICEMLQTVLGESAATVDPAHLTDRSQREKLGAVVWGKRAAFVTEAGNQRIAAELLKTLSGGDRISVCFKYFEAFTAKPTHALILASNDAPKTDAYDDALKERVIALPFVHRLDEGTRLCFEGHSRIESARLDPESALLRGFAAWIGEGLEQLYQSQEIHRAPAVKTATAQFWADTDQLTPFWETIEEEELREGIAKSALRKRYENWCEAEGARSIRPREWARACESQSLRTERRTAGTQFWAK